MLAIRGLVVRYGAVQAIKGIDIDVEQGEIVALLGANGAGKTTIARATAGLLPYQGTITFEDRVLVPNSVETNLRSGLALVPEGRGILARMTVEDNLLMGLYCRRDRDGLGDLRIMLERFPVLGVRLKQSAGLLSGGEQQLLAIARACLSRPRLLILDEPSLGLAPKMTQEVFTMIRALRDGGLTILLAEQRARQAVQFADRCYLLETGRVIRAASAADLDKDDSIRLAFLGSHA